MIILFLHEKILLVLTLQPIDMQPEVVVEQIVVNVTPIETLIINPTSEEDPEVVSSLNVLMAKQFLVLRLNKIDAAISSKSAIAVELENTGIEMDGKPLSLYAPMLRWALGTLGVYILGSDNAEYTAAEWRIIKNNPTPPHLLLLV